VRKAVAVSLLVLASILLGALAAGTPVAGNDTVAARTAGIEFGTAPAARVVQVAAVSSSAIRVLVVVVRSVVAAAGALVVWRLITEHTLFGRASSRRAAISRRGPPAPA
jgi:hypothetical protein